jgi:hypothetical protein
MFEVTASPWQAYTVWRGGLPLQRNWQVFKLLPGIPLKDRLEQPPFSIILAINRSDTQLARYRTPSVHTSFPSLLLS